MRIAGIRVNGYGALSSLEIGDLPPGLTVFCGPNEAGKSTLLDFVRGTLFGFPDRRQRRAFRAPLRGGRHGGMLRLVDDHDHEYVLERYVGIRQVSLTGPDGGALGEEALRRLLGGADDALFSSIFAFGLGELTSFESLDRDEIRELVFSAGVLGAGRSASQALRGLAQLQEALVRPRRSDAVANGLRSKLADLDTDLAEARQRAAHYPSLARHVQELGGELASARRCVGDLRRRDSELERLLTCYPLLARRAPLEHELEQLGSTEPDDERLLLLHAGEIRRLHGDASGHEERRAKRDGLRSDLAGIERSSRELLRDLGPGVDAAALCRAQIGVRERHRAAELAQRAATEKAAIAAREDEVERAAIRVRAALGDLEAAGTAPRTSEEIDGASRSLSQLRSLALEQDRGRAHRAEQIALARITPRAPAGGVASAAVLSLVAVALIAVGALQFATHHDSIGIAALALAIVVAAVAAQTWHHRTEGGSLLRQHGDLDAANTDSARLTEMIAAHCADLRLPSGASNADLDALAVRLEAERDERRRFDALTVESRAARRQLDDAVSRLEGRREALTKVEREVATESAILGLPADLTPDALVQATALIERMRERDAAHARVTAALASLEATIAEFDDEVEALRQRLVPELAPGAPGVLGEFVCRLTAAEARAQERGALIVTMRDIATTLTESLGEGVEAQRLGGELANRPRHEVQAERLELAERLSESEASYERLLNEERDARRLADETLAADDVARLELERAAIAAALDEALERWTTLALAETLLAETLSSYERERQPAVIRRAGELFATVTDGHYVQLVAREDSGGKHHGVEALNRAGERVDAGDLSRGTAEQLYLCLRLAFAETFAESAVALPFVLDDVLVNFDPDRARTMVAAIAQVARRQQVLAFTCHPHIVELFQDQASTVHIVELFQDQASTVHIVSLPRYGLAEPKLQIA